MSCDGKRRMKRMGEDRTIVVRPFCGSADARTHARDHSLVSSMIIQPYGVRVIATASSAGCSGNLFSFPPSICFLLLFPLHISFSAPIQSSWIGPDWIESQAKCSTVQYHISFQSNSSSLPYTHHKTFRPLPFLSLHVCLPAIEIITLRITENFLIGLIIDLLTGSPTFEIVSPPVCEEKVVKMAQSGLSPASHLQQ